jgi:hypothetical protein
MLGEIENVKSLGYDVLVALRNLISFLDRFDFCIAHYPLVAERKTRR